MPDNSEISVLLVDDEDATRYAVGRMLKKAGFTVREAATGQEAIRSAREATDIVLLDVNLPDANGYDICRTLKSDPATSSIPVIHLSASYIRPEDKAYGLNHGAEGYLTHPVEEVVLVATINAILRFRRAEAARLKSEAKYRTLVSVIPALIFTADRDGQWNYVNPQWCTYTGSDSALAMGNQWMSFIHPEDAQHMSSWWSNAKLDEKSSDIEFRIRRHDGAYRWFLCRIAAQKNQLGEFQERFGSCTEIEQQKQTAHALELAAHAKDQFLAVLSHELRTPLTPVLSAAQQMSSYPLTQEEMRELATTIARNIELEVRLIDDLLDVNRIVRGKLRLDLQTTELRQVLRETIRICAADVQANGIRLDNRHGPDPIYVNADPVRLQQIFWNLIKNAVKFTPNGGQIVIDTKLLNRDRVVVTISDNGTGISPEVLPHIFNAFEQGGEGVIRQFGGLGLGLTISNAIAILHGGSLVAHSEGRDKGAAFTLTLPLSQSMVPAQNSTKPADVSPLPAGQKILLVEDHLDTAKLTARILRMWGYKVEIALSANAALEAVGNDSFDLIISDIGLPDRSGLELIREIRLRTPLKAIALSGFGMEDNVQQAVEAGFSAHLIKPVNMNKLRDTILETLAAK